MVETLKYITPRLLRLLVLAASLLGGMAGSLHLYMRFANNTRDEMIDGAGHVDITYSFILFLLAFMPVFVGAILLGGAIVAAWHGFSSSRR